MKIYLDKDFKCYTENDGTRKEYDVSFFDGKCKEFIEGFVFVPEGETLSNKNGEFHGIMISAWKPYSELNSAQIVYERQLLSQYKAQNEEYKEALQTLNVEV